MIFLKGRIGLPKLRYQIIVWTVNSTDQKNIFAVGSSTFGYYTGGQTGTTVPAALSIFF